MFELSETFRNNITSVFREVGVAWLEGLENLIHFFEAQWAIQVREPFLLSYSFCAPAVRPDGSEVVLKLEVPNQESHHRAQALRYYAGRGMVRLLEVDYARGATLMERLKPGRMLVDEISDDEQATRIAAAVMQALWIPAPADFPFRTMKNWAEDFQKIHELPAAGACPMPRSTIECTEALFADLLASAGEQVLLHGDLHHFNILSVAEGSRIGWRAIDPFGVIGEREVEIGAFVRNPNIDLPIDAALEKMLWRRFEIFREMLGFDLQRMLAWASVYSAVSAWWSISDGIDNWKLDVYLADLFADWMKSLPIFS